jgi:hypothetical protein
VIRNVSKFTTGFRGYLLTIVQTRLSFYLVSVEPCWMTIKKPSTAKQGSSTLKVDRVAATENVNNGMRQGSEETIYMHYLSCCSG